MPSLPGGVVHSSNRNRDLAQMRPAVLGTGTLLCWGPRAGARSCPGRASGARAAPFALPCCSAPAALTSRLGGVDPLPLSIPARCSGGGMLQGWFP